MNLRPVPPEFTRFAHHFQDFDRDGPQTVEKLFAFALSSLDLQQKQTLARYLESCLDGTHSEEELRKLWSDQAPRDTVHPATWFFREIHRRLTAS